MPWRPAPLLLRDSYVARFGQHEEWNHLYEMEDWRPPSPKNSEARQRSHFATIFAPNHSLRFALPPTAQVGLILLRVQDVLAKVRNYLIWFRLHKALRGRVSMKRNVRNLHLRLRALRLSTLEEWLAYWQMCEAKAHQGLRRQLLTRPPHAMSQSNKFRQLPFSTRASASVTPDQMKVRVLWDLYWLLRTQYCCQMRTYWDEHHALAAQRRRILSRRWPDGDADFEDGVPMTTRAITAAAFILTLQRPKFHFVAGRDFGIKHLVKMATAEHLPHTRREAAGLPDVAPFAGLSPTVGAFIASALCKQPGAMAARMARPAASIPQLSWHPPCLLPSLLDLVEGLPPDPGSPTHRDPFLNSHRGLHLSTPDSSPRHLHPSGPSPRHLHTFGTNLRHLHTAGSIPLRVRIQDRSPLDPQPLDLGALHFEALETSPLPHPHSPCRALTPLARHAGPRSPQRLATSPPWQCPGRPQLDSLGELPPQHNKSAHCA